MTPLCNESVEQNQTTSDAEPPKSPPGVFPTARPPPLMTIRSALADMCATPPGVAAPLAPPLLALAGVAGMPPRSKTGDFATTTDPRITPSASLSLLRGEKTLSEYEAKIATASRISQARARQSPNPPWSIRHHLVARLCLTTIHSLGSLCAIWWPKLACRRRHHPRSRP